MKTKSILPENAKMNNLLDVIKYFPNEQSCRDFFEKLRWGNNIICPHCKADGASKFKNGKLYWCKSCKKQFTVRVGTILEDSALPLQKWFMALFLVTSRKKGISSVQLAKDLGITQKSAWFMLHRIRHASRTRSLEKPLKGIVEIDETHLGGKTHGQGRGYSQPNKTHVFGMKQRDGVIRARVVNRVNGKTLKPIIRKEVCESATLMTDEFGAYKDLDQEFKAHEVVNHSAKEYVRGNSHTNGIESFWALLKRTYVGTYHFWSKKHADKYIDELEFRCNSKHISDVERFHLMFNFLDGRLTYKSLIAKA